MKSEAAVPIFKKGDSHKRRDSHLSKSEAAVPIFPAGPIFPLDPDKIKIGYVILAAVPKPVVKKLQEKAGYGESSKWKN